jgi:ATP-binding protein involved in chromosome partitioning
LAYRQIAATITDDGALAAGLTTPFAWTLTDGTGKPAAAQGAGTPEQLFSLDHDAGGLLLGWGDGRTLRLLPRDLRIACRCAKCRDEVTGKRLLEPDTVPLDIAVTRIWSVGNYALGMAFGDGHDTGIYTFKQLHAMQGAEVEDV